MWQRERRNGDASEERKRDEEVNAIVNLGVKKMRSRWRTVRLEQLEQAGLGPAFKRGLLHVVNKRTNRSSCPGIAPDETLVEAIINFLARMIDRKEFEQECSDDYTDLTMWQELHGYILEQAC